MNDEHLNESQLLEVALVLNFQTHRTQRNDCFDELHIKILIFPMIWLFTQTFLSLVSLQEMYICQSH